MSNKRLKLIYKISLSQGSNYMEIQAILLCK